MKIARLLPALLLAGCAASSGLRDQVDARNRQLEARYAPTRIVLKEGPGGATSIETGAWAGVVGSTAANDVFRERIFAELRQACGYERSDLREVRVVRHAPPTEWYEVWVFHDPASDRPDKSSGISIVLRYDPLTNRSNVSSYGGCRPPAARAATSAPAGAS